MGFPTNNAIQRPNVPHLMNLYGGTRLHGRGIIIYYIGRVRRSLHFSPGAGGEEYARFDR
jgi:hypothetical protein